MSVMEVVLPDERKTLEFDRDDHDAVKKEFDRLMQTNAVFAYATAQGEKPVAIREFDPEAASITVAPRLIGG